MSQIEIMEFLKNNRGYFTAKMLSKYLNSDTNSVNANIARMRKRNEIKYIERKRTIDERATFLYKYKENEEF